MSRRSQARPRRAGPSWRVATNVTAVRSRGMRNGDSGQGLAASGERSQRRVPRTEMEDPDEAMEVESDAERRESSTAMTAANDICLAIVFEAAVKISRIECAVSTDPQSRERPL